MGRVHPKSSDHHWLVRALIVALANMGALVLPTSLAATAQETESATVRDAIAQLDRVFDRSYAWWGMMYDPQSGGCFYSASAKEAAATDDRFGPDIESVQKLVAVMHWTGLLAEAPEPFKRGVVQYLQQRQDPASGFFRDPQHAESYSPNTLQRATGMAATALERCGGEALHPLPLDRVKNNAEAADHYAMLGSMQALRVWLDGLPWETRAWTAGASLRSHAETFQTLAEPRRSELLDEVSRYVEDKQRDDGFVGSDDDHWVSRLSGTYKLAAFFEMNGLGIPQKQKMAETLERQLFESDFRNSIVLYNAANLYSILHRNGVELDERQRVAIVQRCTKVLATMLGPDGGFVTGLDHTSPTSNGRLVGLDVVESNTNATGLAHKTRSLLIEFLNGQPTPHPHPRDRELLKGLQNSGGW